ncbi:hypothetical protein F2Q69_00010610 [Brassica cretica]|uniref:Uncharacterized protein n=1 Tax=Brassica cretica TaxID=69181 RepID=A0A8S9QZ59_BRACR|nr:hypothetical protein F2Q69_00010610 [Brassica cretica]
MVQLKPSLQFFCAIEPEMRPAWAKSMYEVLKPEGELITLMYPLIIFHLLFRGHDVVAMANPERFVVGLDISEKTLKKASEVINAGSLMF